MCRVEVASTGSSFEHPDSFVILDWKIPKEAYEADLVIDLMQDELSRLTDECEDRITFNSGLDDMVAAGSFLQPCWVLDQCSSGQDYRVK